jgi:hypothetical protein
MVVRWAGRITLALWELPQNVLGVVNLAMQSAAKNVRGVTAERERIMIELRGTGAVSLGLFVFWTAEDSAFVPVGPENRDHEYGHSLQSRLLGPLYLPVVGLPSTMRVLYAAMYRSMTGERWAHYYDGYPERWADRLGGVDLSARPPP